MNAPGESNMTAGPSDCAVAAVGEAAEAVSRGGMVILVEGRSGSRRGSFMVAGERVDAADVAFMATYGRGLISMPMEPARLADLHIPPMSAHSASNASRAPLHVGVDAANVVGSGISAHDRALTARYLADPSAGPDAFSMPGHLFPVAAHPERSRSENCCTDAAVQLARLAGFQPAALTCDILDDEGGLAPVPLLTDLSARHGLHMVDVDDVTTVACCRGAVERVDAVQLPIGGAPFRAVGFRDPRQQQEHIVLALGDLQRDHPLVYVHRACLLGDVFRSLNCQCSQSLDQALDAIGIAGRGAVVYLRGDDGRFVDALAEYGQPADDRGVAGHPSELGHPIGAEDWLSVAAMLGDLGVSTARLMTPCPDGQWTLSDYVVAPPRLVPTTSSRRSVTAARRDAQPSLIAT
jgi:3,4-dihydroxy 2-butanone 4-phosphate synthase / GTP cyclohydrolase II